MIENFVLTRVAPVKRASNNMVWQEYKQTEIIDVSQLK